MKIEDMPKLHSPFIREEINGTYIVTPKIDPDYKWVFEDDSVIAMEKLDGTNVSIVVENGTITSIWNRTARIPVFNKGTAFITEGILKAYERGYCELPDGQHFGELIGIKLNRNPYNVDGHLWVPFDTYCRTNLMYKSWGKYPKTFDTISKWFKDDLFSLLIRKKTGDVVPPEGIVFLQPSTGKMAKLRRDMFDWYKGRRH